MKKILLGFSFLMLAMISEMSFAQRICVPSGTHTVACYDVGGSIPSGLTQGAAVNTRYSTTFSTAAHQQKQCADEKGKIENEFGRCNSAVSKDKLTETGKCNAYGTSAVSGSVEIRIVNLGGTIENPTYEKCINVVNALAENLKDQCAERKTEQEAVARSWNNAQCADFYK